MSALAPALLRLIRDPQALPVPPSAEAHAAAMLRAHVLRALSRASAAAAVPVLLIKGAALALTVYPTPASRAMADIDVLVRPGDRDALLRALEREGGTVHHPAGRPLSRELLGETAVMLQAGSLHYLVEVHTSLDKLVPRPIAAQTLLDRATPAPGLPGLFLPSFEDHALLIALHLAGHDFHHPVGLLDLELLLRRGLDTTALVERARGWALSSVMFVSLSTLRALGAASVSEALIAAFAPGPLRRALLGRTYPPGAPAPDEGDSLGWPWVLRQTPLRDDPLPWLLGLGRYAALRARERSAARAEARLSRPGAGGQDAGVSYRVPRWVRALLAVDRVALRLDNLRDGLRDELMLAFVPEAERGALTAALYEDQSTYLPGGQRYQSGLFSWERKVLEAPAFPRAGRVLLGACGAGRELVALVERGFTVTAFDPCAPFVEAARAQTDAARATVRRASYADLVGAVEGRGGPLGEALAEGPFAAVILGWGSFSHVMPARERLRLLRAAAAAAPGAPLLMSFALEPDSFRAPAEPAEGEGGARAAPGRARGACGARCGACSPRWARPAPRSRATTSTPTGVSSASCAAPSCAPSPTRPATPSPSSRSRPTLTRSSCPPPDGEKSERRLNPCGSGGNVARRQTGPHG